MTVLAAGEDSFDASSIGEAAEVVQEVVCDDELILIKGWVIPLHSTDSLKKSNQKIAVFQDVTLCILVDRYEHFGGTDASVFYPEDGGSMTSYFRRQ